MTDTNQTMTDDTDLIERVAELEAQVEALKNESPPTIGRRGVLGGLAGLAGAGALGGALYSQPAAAATADGYVQTGELRDGNNNTLATLNNGGPVDFQVPISTEELSNGFIRERKLLHDLPANPPVSSLSFSVDADTYDGFDLFLTGSAQSGDGDVVIKSQSAASGDYSYVERDGATLNETSTADNALLMHVKAESRYQARVEFVSGRGIVIYDGAGRDPLPTAQAKMLSANIDVSPSGSEGFEVSVPDGLTRIERIGIVGWTR